MSRAGMVPSDRRGDLEARIVAQAALLLLAVLALVYLCLLSPWVSGGLGAPQATTPVLQPQTPADDWFRRSPG